VPGICWLEGAGFRDLLVSVELNGDAVFAVFGGSAPRPRNASCPFTSIARRATAT